MSHWVLIEAQRPDLFEHVLIGPFPDQDAATAHLQDSLQVQAMCADDALDAWTLSSDEQAEHATGLWDAAGQPWGRYRPVRDTQAVDLRGTTGDPTGLALLPSGRITGPGRTAGRAR